MVSDVYGRMPDGATYPTSERIADALRAAGTFLSENATLFQFLLIFAGLAWIAFVATRPEKKPVRQEPESDILIPPGSESKPGSNAQVPDTSPWIVRGIGSSLVIEALESARQEGLTLLHVFGTEPEGDIHSPVSVARYHQLNRDLEIWIDKTERILRTNGRQYDAASFTNCPKTTRVSQMRCHLDRLATIIDQITKGG